MKKISLLHYAYPPNIGGVEQLISEQAHILSRLGFDIEVLTGAGEEADSRVRLFVEEKLQSVMCFDPTLQEKIIGQGIVDDDFYSLARIIEKKLEDHLADRDAVIVHNMLTLVHNLPFIHAFKNYHQKHPRQRLIVWVHDQTFIDEEKILEKKPGLKLNSFEKELLMTPIPDAVYVAISETFKILFTKVVKMSSNRVKVIENGVDIKRFLEIDDSVWDVVKEKGLLGCFPLIISPVNILPRKNIEYSLEIIRYLKDVYPKVVLLISGRVSTHRNTVDYLDIILKKIALLGLSRQVIFLDEHFKRYLFASEMHDFYVLSDAVFYFSKSENFGLPILESCLSKTPIFVSNLNVFKEIGGDNLVYIDFTKEDPRAVCGIVRDYLEKNTLIGMNRIVRQNYDLESIIKEKLLPIIE